MATAGNIILNLGRTPTGRYVVRPQGRLFAAAKEEDPMRTVSGLMTTLKQAKGIADMVAPFLSQEYQPPVQQGEIAAQRLDTAQQELAAAQQQLQQTQKTLQPMPVEDASVQQMLRANEMLQAAQTPEQVAEAQRLYAQSQESQAAAKDIQQARASMLQAQQERIDPLMQRVALERQAVAEAPPMLPMFQTLAEADAALEAASAARDVDRYNQIVAGLQYSPLTDIPLAKTIGDINPLQRRQKAIADLVKRHRVTPAPTMSTYQSETLRLRELAMQQRDAQAAEQRAYRDLQAERKQGNWEAQQEALKKYREARLENEKLRIQIAERRAATGEKQARTAAGRLSVARRRERRQAETGRTTTSSAEINLANKIAAQSAAHRTAVESASVANSDLAKAKREASNAKAVVRTAQQNLAQAKKAAQNTDLTKAEREEARIQVANARKDLASANAGVRAARGRVRAAKRLRDQATARADKTGRTVNATTKNFNTKYPNSTYVVE